MEWVAFICWICYKSCFSPIVLPFKAHNVNIVQAVGWCGRLELEGFEFDPRLCIEYVSLDKTLQRMNVCRWVNANLCKITLRGCKDWIKSFINTVY